MCVGHPAPPFHSPIKESIREPMSLFNLQLESPDTLKVGFGAPATNAAIVSYVDITIQAMKLPGGKLLKIDGPASLPVAFVLAHRLCHLYGAIAVLDPKLEAFVVVISHNPDYTVGDLIPKG